ncbi:MAG: MBL fold metallo-hydrolase [Tetrasphaera sp.]
MRLTIIGCSGSFAGPESPASCYLIQAESDGRTHRVLVDLGSGALGALQRHLDPADIDAILLTHLHPDHCLDLTGLYVYRKYHPTHVFDHPLPVYGPAGARERLHAAYEGIDAGGMDGQYRFQVITDGDRLGFGPVRVTAREVRHPVQAYGFRVEADGVVLALTGDTDSCPALTDLCRDADLVLADSAFVEGRDAERGIHLTGRRAAEAGLAGGARRLMLTHIPSWNDPQVCRAQAGEVWPGEVELAEPGASYELRIRD